VQIDEIKAFKVNGSKSRVERLRCRQGSLPLKEGLSNSNGVFAALNKLVQVRNLGGNQL
jgi:hypothetical protein